MKRAVLFVFSGVFGLAIANPAASAASPPLTLEDLVPPPVIASENAAPLYLSAMDLLEAEKVWNTDLAGLAAEVGASRGGNLVDITGLRIPDEGNRQAIVADVQEEFIRHLDYPSVSRAMELIAAAAARPRCRFDIDYSKGADTQLAHLSRLRTLGRFLSAMSSVSAELGDMDTAWSCALWSLQLAEHLNNEPVLVSQLVRIAIVGMAVQDIHDLAEQELPDEDRLKSIDRLLASLEDTGSWAAALHGERLLIGDWLFSRPPEEVFEQLKKIATPEEAGNMDPAQVAQQKADYDRMLLRLAKLMEQPYYTAKPEVAAIMAEAKKPSRGTAVRALIPNLDVYFERVTVCRTAAQVTRIGLRLMQQAGKEAAEAVSYPSRIPADLLSDIPADQQNDPFSGQPLKYTGTEKGFLLYSIGPDGEDNGGTPRKDREKSGYDIVWNIGQ